MKKKNPTEILSFPIGYNTYIFDSDNQILTLSNLLYPCKKKDILQERGLVITKEQLQKSFQEITYIIFEVTEKCNFRCYYCGQGENYVQSPYRPLNRNMDMSWPTAKNILDYYISIWNENLPNKSPVYICFYGGEPLLNITLVKTIAEYIDYNKPDNLDIVFNITSNGYLLRKHIDYLVKHKFQLEISLDGDKYANSYRKDAFDSETFSIVASNLDFVKMKYPDYFDSFIEFQAVVNNKSNIINIYDFFHSRYNKKPKLMEISRTNLSSNSSINEFYVNLDEVIKKAIVNNPNECYKYDLKSQNFEDYIEFIISTLSKNHFDNYNELMYRAKSPNRIKSSTCIPFDYKLDITASGYLFPCERTEYQLPLGRVTSKGIMIDFEKIAEDYTRYFNHYAELCSTCLHKHSCKYCFYCDKDFYKDDSKCSRYQKVNVSDVVNMVNFLKKNPHILKKLTSDEL